MKFHLERAWDASTGPPHRAPRETKPKCEIARVPLLRFRVKVAAPFPDDQTPIETPAARLNNSRACVENAECRPVRRQSFEGAGDSVRVYRKRSTMSNVVLEAAGIADG